MEKVISTAPSSVATSALRAIPFENIIGGPLQACVKAQRLAAQTTVDFIREVGLEDVPVRDPKGEIVKAPRLDKYGNVIKDSKDQPIMDPVLEKKAVYVCFQFIQAGRLVRLNVPMLSIVPIPYIAINTIDISFKANIKAQASAMDQDAITEADDRTSSNYNSSWDTQSSRSFGRSGRWWNKNRSGHNESSYSSDYSRNSMQASISSKKDSVGTRESKYSVEYTMDVAVHASQDSMPAGMAKVLELIGNAMDVCNPEGEFLINNNILLIAQGKKGTLEVVYKTPEGLLSTRKEDFWLKKKVGDSTSEKDSDLLTVRNKDRASAELEEGEYLLSNAEGTLTETIKVVVAKTQS
ncbi:DUF2589 domain-containing protein [Porphyromonas sp. COT-290 OH860]|uniref:DUF2589 domain-containing protein n=1 Tax=Porphyromonas sp. COT-290 OH860 TaxID=1515615 RepID=UPI00052BBCD3|nr:DUF2589 domain-containing protein [Porphyromonas sp. COT-290 OH860]KGN83620.1 hypothetical protein HQ41_06805 [Porphyromonas sp. COT-290 OH860]